MPLYALHQPLLPASGCSHAVSVRLTPPKQRDLRPHRGALLTHLVAARDDVVHVYEIRGHRQQGQQQRVPGRGSQTEPRIFHLRTHRAFGVVTGLGAVRVAAPGEPARDCVLLSLADAKIALLEWSQPRQALETVSIHTYERAPQLSDGLPSHFRPLLAIDPASRCAALLLPRDALAVLPFDADSADFELIEELELEAEAGAGAVGDEGGGGLDRRRLPYSPSFVLALADVDARVRNVRDVVFLPGYRRPTAAVLFEPQPTWTGRLNERRDTCSVFLITLDLSVASSHPLISAREALPYDCLYLRACPPELGGGVVVVARSCVFHLDQSGRAVGVATSSWSQTTSDVAPLPMWTQTAYDGRRWAEGTPDEQRRAQQLDLQDSQLLFPNSGGGGGGGGVASRCALVALADGRLFALEFHLDGRTLTSLSLHAKLGAAPAAPAAAAAAGAADLPPPSLLESVLPTPHPDGTPTGDDEGGGGAIVLAGSMVGGSKLLRLEAVEAGDGVVGSGGGAAAGEGGGNEAADAQDDMDLDEELYGDSSATLDAKPANGHAGLGGGGGGTSGSASSFEVSVCAEELPALGPLLDAKPVLLRELVAAEPTSASQPMTGWPSSGAERHVGEDEAEREREQARREGLRYYTAVCAGARSGASISLLEPRVKPRKRRRLNLDAPRGLWSLGRRRGGGPLLLLASSDAHSELCTLPLDARAVAGAAPGGDGRGEVSLVARLRGATLAAALVPADDGDGLGDVEATGRIVRVTERGLEVLDQAGKVVQSEGRRGGRRRQAEPARSGAGVGSVYRAAASGRYAALVWSDGCLEVWRLEAGEAVPLDEAAATEAGEEMADGEAPPSFSSVGEADAHLAVLFEDVTGVLEVASAAAASGASEIAAGTNGSGGSAMAGRGGAAAPNVASKRAQELDDDEEIDYGDSDDEDGPKEPPSTHDVASAHIAGNDIVAAAAAAEHGGGGDGDADAREKQGAPCWLMKVTSLSQLELYDLPGRTLRWRSDALALSPAQLVHRAAEEASALAELPGFEVAEVCAATLGDVLHIAVAYRSGLLVVYEAVAHEGAGEDDEDGFGEGTNKATSATAEPHLALSMNKVLSMQLHDQDATPRPPDGEEVEGLGVSLRPVGGRAGGVGGDEAVFVGGPTPGLLMRPSLGPLAFVPLTEGGVDHLVLAEPVAMPGEDEASVVYSQHGMAFSAHLPAMELSPTAGVRCESIRTGRQYSRVVCHTPTETLLASSLNEQRFALFDPEDQRRVQDPDADPTPAQSLRSALELFVAGSDEPIDGFEFDQNEVVLALECVRLFSQSTASGLREYVAVGTMRSHGEDRPVRGALYLFDVIETVYSRDDPLARYKLRLVVRDEAKGPLLHITDLNGYLAIVLGTKLLVRSLETDQWLVTIAFLDVPFHITHLRRLKNFLLLGDVKKSAWFVAFQEEPFRLVLLSKDYNEVHLTTAEFVVGGTQMAVATTSRQGALRLLDYNPSLPASQGGQKLLVRTEYQLASEVTASMLLPGREAAGGVSLDAEILYAMANGAVESVVPVREERFKRLQLLQGQLVRHVQHFAGLNPRGFRAVRNDHVSRPLTKGILDGALLASFASLPTPKMLELAAAVAQQEPAPRVATSARLGGGAVARRKSETGGEGDVGAKGGGDASDGAEDAKARGAGSGVTSPASPLLELTQRLLRDVAALRSHWGRW